jgi:hypothetical protein
MLVKFRSCLNKLLIKPTINILRGISNITKMEPNVITLANQPWLNDKISEGILKDLMEGVRRNHFCPLTRDIYEFSNIIKEQEQNRNFVDPRNPLWLSRYGKYKYPYNLISKNELRVVDFLILNKNYCIHAEDVDRFMGLIHYNVRDPNHIKECGLFDNNCIIDGWSVIEVRHPSIPGYEVDGKFIPEKYPVSAKITYHDDFDFSRKNLSHTKDDITKLICAKTLVQLMDNTDLSMLNIHNYFAVNKWIHFNDVLIESQQFELEQENKKLIINDNYINNNNHIKLDDVLTIKDIKRIIDLYLKNRFEFLNGELKNSVPVINFKNVDYNIIVNENGFVDMNQFRNMVSSDGLKWIINEINEYRRHHVNCGDVPAEELLHMLYRHSDNGYKFPHTVKDMKDILEKDKKISYIGESKLFLDFSNYPIMDIQNYNWKQNGYFEFCLKKCKEHRIKTQSKGAVEPFVDMYNK